MARASLALGTHGSVSVTAQCQKNGRWRALEAGSGAKADRYRASTRYRDRAGKVSQLEAFGRTKGQARGKLNRRIADIEVEAELRATARTDSTLASMAARWLVLVESDAHLSDNSKAHYRGTWRRCLEESELASLPLSEVNVVSTLRIALQGIADERGSGSAKSARSVLSGIIGMAVDDGLLPMNAIRGIKPVRARHERKTARDTRRALTVPERDRLIATADGHPRALAQDVADVIAYMAATGVRIGEALGQRWSDVDLKAATVHVRGTKSKASDRVLGLPASLVKRLRARSEANGRFGYVFPSPQQRYSDRPRDQRNVARIMRVVLDEAGLPWATPHSLRRTALTMILEAGHSPTVAAAQAGHADTSVTLRTYAAKRLEPSQVAASVLEIGG